jgi:hypothetical protein
MIALDLSKLKVGQHTEDPSSQSWTLPSFTFPSLPPPSPRSPQQHYCNDVGGCKHSDYMECDEPTFEMHESSSHILPPLILPAEPMSPKYAYASGARGRGSSRLSLQQLQKEGHDSPSSPTDNKLGLDLRKAALIRSLLFKSCEQVACDAAAQHGAHEGAAQHAQQEGAPLHEVQPSASHRRELEPTSTAQHQPHSSTAQHEAPHLAACALRIPEWQPLRGLHEPVMSPAEASYPAGFASVQLTPPLFRQQPCSGKRSSRGR